MTNKPSHAVRKLGDILVECRVVTQEQVDLALAEQRRSGKKLFGEALIDLGFISEDDLGWALSNQLNVPYIDLTADMVDLGAVSLLGSQLMRRHRLLPLVRVGDALTVVLADPTNLQALHEVEVATGLTVQASISSPRKIVRVLDEVLGADMRHDEAPSDLLFAEITRPSLGDSDESARSNPLGLIFSSALRENVEEVHLEPAGEWVRVRFRKGATLLEQPPIQSLDLRQVVERFTTNVPARRMGCPDIPMWQSTVEFSAGVLDLTVTLLPTPSGTGLVLEVRRGRTRPVPLDDLGLPSGERGILTRILTSGGLVIVTGPDPVARLLTLSALGGAAESASRRMVAFGARLSLRWDGLTHFAPVDPVASPATIRRELYSFRFIDTLLLDEIEPGADCDRAVTAASCGKLILGGSHAPDALTLLAVLAEQAASRTALGHGLSAIMETRLSAAGAPEAALLPIEPLVGVLERSGARTRLAAAALAAGFRSLNDVATPTDREAA